MIRRRRPDRSDDRPADEEGPSLELPADDDAGEAGTTPDSDANEPAGDPSAPASDTAPEPVTAAPPEAGPEPQEQAVGRGRKGRRKNKNKGKPPEATAGDSTDAEKPTSGEGSGDSGSGGGAPPTAERKRRGGAGVALALLLALAAGAAAGWLGWRLLQLEEQVAAIPEQRQAALEPLASADAVDELERQIEQRTGTLEDRIEEQTSGLEQRLASLEDERTAAVDRLRQRLDAAETAIQSVRDQRQRTGLDWRMAEVRFLVSMAANRLAITGDVPSAIAALEAADATLGRMGDPRVLDLRERIVERIGALKEVEPADVEGIAVRIQNLAPRIPQLVRASDEPTGPDQDAAASAENGGASTDQGADGWWARLRERLSGLVSVRREAAPAPPAPASEPASSDGSVPSAEVPPGERLLLALKDASRAALNHDPQAYDAALGRALQLLEAAYADDAPGNQRFREALEELRDRRVTTQLPELATLVERTRALAGRLAGGGGAAQQGGN